MRKNTWIKHLTGNAGLGLVNAMLALSLLGVFALVAASLAVNEKRSTFNDRVHLNAFVSADSGGEVAVAWLRNQPRPPFVVDFGANMRVHQISPETMDATDTDQSYDYNIRMRSGAEGGARLYRFGSDTNFVDYYYVIDSHGNSGTKGESDVNLVVSRLALSSYNN